MFMWYALTFHMTHTNCYIMWYASNQGLIAQIPPHQPTIFTDGFVLGDREAYDTAEVCYP